MIALPRVLALGVVGTFAVFTFVLGIVALLDDPHVLSSAVGLAMFSFALVVGLTRSATDPLSTPLTVVVTVVGLVAPVIGSTALDPATGSLTTGGWGFGAVITLVMVLFLSRRQRWAWLVIGGGVVHTLIWAGPSGLLRFGVVAAVLFGGVITVLAWAIGSTAAEIARHSEAERETMRWRAAQDAHRSERGVRLMNTALVAAPVLQRIVDAEDGLTEADRAECRLLEQTIRDEIRGRRLLNDAVREQVMAHRRRGAAVQVDDDGGLDDLDPRDAEPLLAAVAVAIADLTSDRIVIRTASVTSAKAVTVVATSFDPIASAPDDDDEGSVDLWLELDRPVIA